MGLGHHLRVGDKIEMFRRNLGPDLTHNFSVSYGRDVANRGLEWPKN